VKKARYGIEFFHGLLPQKRAQRWTAALKRVQDSLGHMNDLDVAERTIGRLVGERPVDERLVGTGAENRKLAAAARTIRRTHKKAARDAEPDIRKQCRRLTRIALF